MGTNVLVVGSGGREHALGWKLSQSPLVDEVFFAPGNGGTAVNAALKIDQFEGLADFAARKECFTVVGPDDALAAGISDFFEDRGLPILAPRRQAAILEWSKIFAKRFMKKAGIRTASFEVFDDFDDAVGFVKKRGVPLVVKADGLALGKGAVVCWTVDEAEDALRKMMVEGVFGVSGRRVVVEDFLRGYEVSCIGVTDGESFISLGLSQDHKQVFDDDKGANTGGMGAYCPVPMVSEELEERIVNDVMLRAVQRVEAEGLEYKGVLYAGLMIVDDLPYVLEFNCRFGDPETQPTMLRMESDLFPYLVSCAEGDLGSTDPVVWKRGSAVCVVMASAGYPQKYEIGKAVTGIGEAGSREGVVVFHAGTSRTNDTVVTSGGRVLGVTALGKTLDSAVSKAYDAVSTIRFEGAHYRKDIAQKAKMFLGGQASRSVG